MSNYLINKSVTISIFVLVAVCWRAQASISNIDSNEHHSPADKQQLDAPKYYGLNALLYKPHQDLRPLDGSRRAEGSDGASSMDGLIESMRRQSNEGGSGDDSSSMRRKVVPNGIRSEDEATIQRKSTNIPEDSSGLDESPSRLRGKFYW